MRLYIFTFISFTHCTRARITKLQRSIFQLQDSSTTLYTDDSESDRKES